LAAENRSASQRPHLKLNARGIHIRSRRVRYEVADHPTLRRDPSLRIRWEVTVRKPDGTEGLVVQDHWADDTGARTLLLDLWQEEFYVAKELVVRLIHYRPGGTELMNVAQSVTVLPPRPTVRPVPPFDLLD
jgi:hypothetical protein